MAITGVEFKKRFGNVFYKFLSKDLVHHSFIYRLGINEDTLQFNPNGSCQTGGLYFSNLENILRFLEYGPKLGLISIPDDALIYVEKYAFKTNKLILREIMDSELDILKILKWSRNNCCPWDEWTTVYAARNNHFKILKWALENGCSWNEWTCLYAMKKRKLNILKLCISSSRRKNAAVLLM